MKNFLVILGWLILLFVVICNQVINTMSTPIIIVLCVISAICMSIGILMKKNKR